MSNSMARRFTVTIPDDVAAKLDRWSETRGQAFATTAAVAIELAVRQAERDGEFDSASAGGSAPEEKGEAD